MTRMNLREQYDNYFLNVYGQVGFIPVAGSGSRLFGADGGEVIDFSGGIAVNALGHAHPELIEALTEQACKLWHVGNTMVNQPAVLLGKLLIENSCFDKAFFCNSGSEAVEAGLKLARRYALKNYGKDKHTILAFKKSFHGRSLFSVSVSGQTKLSEDFAPLPPGIKHATFNEISDLERLIDANTAAVIVEPMQAEGGCLPAKKEFLARLRALCDRHAAILIFDEVQTGIGRTGKLFAYKHYDITPDAIAIAKALGGGFPIGALLVKDKFSTGFTQGMHGSTFGGNPLACAVAHKALSLILAPGHLSGVLSRAQIFKQLLEKINKELKMFSEIRMLGLLIGAELQPKYKGLARKIMHHGFKEGVAVLMASDNVMRLAPSHIISHEDIYQGMECLYKTLVHIKSEV